MVDRQKLDWLQSLRGLAALSVVLVHCRHFFRGADPSLTIDHWFLPLASGVDLFFVVSGFIMVYATHNGAAGLATALQFWWRRLIRVWPTYIAITVVYFVYYVWLRGTTDNEQILRLVRSILFIPQNVDGFFFQQVVPVGWSLTYEILFYFYFGLALLAPGRWRWMAVAVGAILLLVVVPLALGTTSLWQPMAPFSAQSYPWAPLLRVAVNPILWEFAFGMIAGLIYFSPLRVESAPLRLALVGLTAAAVAANIFLAFDYLTLQMGLGYAVLVSVVAICAKTPGRFRTPRLLVRLGDISYALYLIHWLVIDIVWTALGQWDQVDVSRATVATLVTLACSIAAAAALSPLLERRLSHWIGAILEGIAHGIRARRGGSAARKTSGA